MKCFGKFSMKTSRLLISYKTNPVAWLVWFSTSSLYMLMPIGADLTIHTMWELLKVAVDSSWIPCLRSQLQTTFLSHWIETARHRTAFKSPISTIQVTRDSKDSQPLVHTGEFRESSWCPIYSALAYCSCCINWDGAIPIDLSKSWQSVWQRVILRQNVWWSTLC